MHGDFKGRLRPMRVHLVLPDAALFALVGAAWCIAIAFVWLRRHDDPTAHREADFLEWRVEENRMDASFSEFMGSEQVPRAYLSRAEWSAVITALAAMVICFVVFK